MGTRVNQKISIYKTTQRSKRLINIELFILNGGWIIRIEFETACEFDCMYCLTDKLGCIRNVRALRWSGYAAFVASLLCHFALDLHKIHFQGGGNHR